MKTIWVNVNKRNNGLKVNESYEEEPLEVRIGRMIRGGQPIEADGQLMYEDRSKGVKAEYDIRTDKWDVAMDAMGIVSKTEIAKRNNSGKLVGGSTEAVKE